VIVNLDQLHFVNTLSTRRPLRKEVPREAGNFLVNTADITYSRKIYLP